MKLFNTFIFEYFSKDAIVHFCIQEDSVRRLNLSLTCTSPNILINIGIHLLHMECNTNIILIAIGPVQYVSSIIESGGLVMTKTSQLDSSDP